MAEKHWLGVNSNLTDTANYSLTRGGAGGAAVPTTDDDAFYEIGIPPATNLSGITDILGSLTWTLPGPVGVPGGNPLSISVSGTSGLSPARSGQVRIKNATSVNLQAAGAAGIDKLSLELPSNATAVLTVTSTGGFAANSGDYIHIDGGQVNLSGEAAAASGTKIRVISGSLTGEADASFTFQSVTVARAASFRTKRSCVSLTTDGFSQTIDAAGVSTLLTVNGSGRHNHIAYGTIADSEVLPGGKADTNGSSYSFTLTAKKKWKGGDNFDTSSNIINTPTVVQVGETSN